MSKRSIGDRIRAQAEAADEAEACADPAAPLPPGTVVTRGRTRAEATRSAGEILAEGDLFWDTQSPRAQAEAAWTPTSRYTVDELEDRIRARRGLPPVRGSAYGSSPHTERQ